MTPGWGRPPLMHARIGIDADQKMNLGVSELREASTRHGSASGDFRKARVWMEVVAIETVGSPMHQQMSQC
eukprot:2928088-Amphidinium_carterae.1